MKLPFDYHQFVNVFALYNQDFIWLVVLLWVVTANSIVLVIIHRPIAHTFLNLTLVFHWLWSGLAYHLAYFSDINPAAKMFSVAFILEALLLGWRGLLKRNTVLEFKLSNRNLLGLAVMTYGLLYPLLSLLLGEAYPYVPLFAVPCPTTIITLGWLLMLPRKEFIILAPIPLAWSVIGGSAAVLLSISADYGMIMAGMIVLFYLVIANKDGLKHS